MGECPQTCMKYAFIPARSLSALLFYHIILFHSAFTRKKSGAEVLIVSSEDFLPEDFSQIIFSGFSQVITSPDMELDEDTRQNINHQITENTNRITGLVNKMLELSDAKSQTFIERKDNVSVVQIASEAVETSGINTAKHLTFDFQVPEKAEKIVLQTNLNAAVRALSLLLDNARKFTAPAGTHADNLADASFGRPQQVVLRLHSSDNCLYFVVEDTGIGVPEDEAERIFDEFVQLDNYYDGTGIGLTVARSLARRLGGDIVLDTSYKGGARFVMILPMKLDDNI